MTILIATIVATMIGGAGPAEVDGPAFFPDAATEIWAGPLETPAGTLRLELHVTTSDAGERTAQLFSLDQGNTPIPVSEINIDDGKLAFTVDVISGSFEGDLNETEDVADGVWRQGGGELPLRLTRREAP